MATTTKRQWEDIFSSWANPPSDAEKQRCANAVTAVQKAIDASSKLSLHDIYVTPQGSFLNGTNVRLDSDVDLAVRCRSVYLTAYPTGVSDTSAGLVDAGYSYSEYKNDVQSALEAHFGRFNVHRGNKAFDINENTYRVDADAVACMLYREYYYNWEGRLCFHEGQALIADDTRRRHVSFPIQQERNATAKNVATQRRFKKVVRIIKRLRNEMKDEGVQTADKMPSFLLECLVWNVPNESLTQSSLKTTVLDSLAFIWESTKPTGVAKDWLEENGINPLFGSTSDWTLEQVNQFAYDAWNYVNAS